MSARFGYKSPYPKERARLIGYAYFSSFPPFSESRSPFLLLYPIFFSDTCRIHHIGTGIGIYPMYPKFKWRSDTIEMHFGYDFILLIVQMSHLNDERSRLREMTHRIDKLGHWLESDLIGRFQTLFRESVKFCVCNRFASVFTRIGISRLRNYYFHTKRR